MYKILLITLSLVALAFADQVKEDEVLPKEEEVKEVEKVAFRSNDKKVVIENPIVVMTDLPHEEEMQADMPFYEEPGQVQEKSALKLPVFSFHHKFYHHKKPFLHPFKGFWQNKQIKYDEDWPLRTEKDEKMPNEDEEIMRDPRVLHAIDKVYHYVHNKLHGYPYAPYYHHRPVVPVYGYPTYHPKVFYPYTQ